MRLLSLFSAALLVACASASISAQDTGTRMATEAERAGDRADDKADLAKQWKKGDKMSADGSKLIRSSERKVASLTRDATKYQARADRALVNARKAQDSIADGRRMVEAGSDLKAQAEARFPLVPPA